MSSILNSSKLINVLYENDRDNENYEEFLEQQLLEATNLYNLRFPNYQLTIETVHSHLTIFERLQIHDTFIKPELKEYFNKRLNYLLIIDFLISFGKVRYPSQTNFQYINADYIFELFVSLSHFYNLMSYLDVSPKFLEYIKYLIVLYLQSLNRHTIEEQFGHIIWELDEFFKHNVIKELYIKFNPIIKHNYVCMSNIKSLHSEKLKAYNPNINYMSSDYVYLDDFFEYSKGYINNKMKIVYDNISDIDDDVQTYIDDDNYSDYSIDNTRYECVLKKTDPNYELHEALFVYKMYQKHMTYLEEFETNLKSLQVMISDLTCLKENPTNILQNSIRDHHNMLTYVGMKLEHYDISYNLTSILKIAYDMSYVEIIKEIINTSYVLQPNIITLENFVDKKEINDLLCSKYPSYKIRYDNTTKFISLI
jgi:hypothetical protein